ncbi:MAG: DNA repair protein RadC [Clostridia bacterium]|nr:DNA repair protein RadC [Clostridia bacterium]
MAKEANIHAGHRQRLRQSLLAADFSGMSDINLLEALLFYAIPRGDTNETAHRLLETFGSVAAVFEADYRSLMQVEGVGENTAFLIKLMCKTAKRIGMAEVKKAVPITTSELAAEVFQPYFIGEKDEIMLAMYLDNAARLIRVDKLGSGVVNSVSFHNRKLMEGALATNCVAVVLAHNHPHGVPNPSREDLRLTQNARESLRTIGVGLNDHMIYAEGEWRCISERPDAAQYLTKVIL